MHKVYLFRTETQKIIFTCSNKKRSIRIPGRNDNYESQFTLVVNSGSKTVKADINDCIYWGVRQRCAAATNSDRGHRYHNAKQIRSKGQEKQDHKSVWRQDKNKGAKGSTNTVLISASSCTAEFGDGLDLVFRG